MVGEAGYSRHEADIHAVCGESRVRAQPVNLNFSLRARTAEATLQVHYSEFCSAAKKPVIQTFCSDLRSKLLGSFYNCLTMKLDVLHPIKFDHVWSTELSRLQSLPEVHQ